MRRQGCCRRACSGVAAFGQMKSSRPWRSREHSLSLSTPRMVDALARRRRECTGRWCARQALRGAPKVALANRIHFAASARSSAFFRPPYLFRQTVGRGQRGVCARRVLSSSGALVGDVQEDCAGLEDGGAVLRLRKSEFGVSCNAVPGVTQPPSRPRQGRH